MQLTQDITQQQQHKLITKLSQSLSLPCTDYISIICNNRLCLLQCFTSVTQKQQRMFIYNQENNKWDTHNILASKNKSINNYVRVGSARVLIGDNLYFFGGKDNKGKLDNHLNCLNLQKRQWGNQIQIVTGLLPQSRAYAFLGSYHQRFLILLGGTYFTLDGENSQSIYVFDIVNSKWHRVANFTLPIVPNQILSMHEDKIYILCNKHPTVSGGLASYLLQIKIEYNAQNETLPLNFQKNQTQLHKQTQPNILPGTYFIQISHKSQIILIFQVVNKNFNSKPITRLWIYDILTQNFSLTRVQLQAQPFQILSADNNQYFILYDTKKYQFIQKFTISSSQLNKQIMAIRYKQWKKCQICYQASVNNNFLMEPAFKITDQLLDCLTEKITFPFAAFGLFADNALNHYATYLNFKYSLYGKDPILIVEDDARTNYSNQQLEQIVVNFTAETNYNFGSVQKRIRNVLTKQFLRRQFGTNLKVASMRLGSEMLYVSLTPNFEARVAYFAKQKDQYVCYYYAFDEKTGKVFQQYSPFTKFYVQSKYGDLINQSLHAYSNHLATNKYAPYKNSTYIIGLKTVINDTGKQVLEISPLYNPDNRDIQYVNLNYNTYKGYMQYGCKIDEAIDVSLLQYLTHLYIKNQHMKISVQLNDYEKRYTKKQEMFDYGDKNISMKIITRIDNALKNFELKSTEMYFNSKINRKLGIFHNGVLIYHKNRLVKRFGCELGQLLNLLELSQSVVYGHFHLFGRIQVPDSLEVNQQKTDFLNQLMLQKLFSKLKMMHELFLQNITTEKQFQKLKVSKQGPKLRSRASQNPEPRQFPIKKIKRSQDDDSYNAI